MNNQISFIHDSAVVDNNVQIGADSKVWHFVHISSGAIIGERCILGQNVFIGNNVRVGSGTKIQNNVSVYSGVEIEEDVFIGPSVVFTNVINPRSFIERKKFAPTNLGKGASIGANATIVCGNHIGAYALIGAGSVVTNAVAPYEMVYGVPARHKGWVSKAGHVLEFNEMGIARCEESKEEYTLNDNCLSVREL